MRFLLISSLVALAGCSTQPYLPPPGPTAKVRVIAIPPNNNDITLGSDPNCVSERGPRLALLGINANSTFNTRGASRRVGVPDPKEELLLQTTEFLVSAGSNVVIQSSAVTATNVMTYSASYCKRAVSFVPEADASYEIIYAFEPYGRCTMDVSKFVATPDSTWNRVRVPNQTVVEQSCR
jgi:hypothetical protein